MNTIGTKTLYAVRSARNHMHIRLFVIAEEGLREVTGQVARACNLRTTNDKEYITVRGQGHNAVAHVADVYGMTVNPDKQPHPYVDMG